MTMNNVCKETGESVETSKIEQVFRDLNVEDDPEVMEIESLCLHCGENGITKLLLTKIPFYKEVVVSSFSCNHCGWDNNSLEPASKIQDKGVHFQLRMQKPEDLTRLIVKTEWASLRIPDLEFEIPAKSQEGTITTIESILERTCTGLRLKMETLKNEDPDSAFKLDEFLKKFLELKSGTLPFTFILSDCSGNSFVQSLCAPLPDPQLEKSHYSRSQEEDMMLGIYIPDEDGNPEIETEASEDRTNFTEEVLSLPTNCFSCNAPCITNMKVTQIPHFKDVVIMSTRCDTCGHKTNEIKSGSGIEPLGYRATLKIQEAKDLTRDVVKSDSCRILIKELELDVGPAAFGSRYSTVEGLITVIKEQLKESNPFISGDSADLWRKEKLGNFLAKIDEVLSCELKVTFVLDDPTGNSYIQSIDHPHPDTNLVVENYQRSTEQDEELGLLDMKVENYEES